jgi:hypothetical protein
MNSRTYEFEDFTKALNFFTILHRRMLKYKKDLNRLKYKVTVESSSSSSKIIVTLQVGVTSYYGNQMP